jgi:hypothetical protein
MSQPISVVMPVYEGVTQLDFTGPHQFLGAGCSASNACRHPPPPAHGPRALELGDHEPADELVGADRALRGSPIAFSAITGKIAGRQARSRSAR